MAEHFYGRNNIVHFSNGATESLYHAWLTLGETLSTNSETEAVLVWLRALSRHGAGLKSFSLNPPPDEINSPERLSFLSKIVAAFAVELAKEQPNSELTDISWDRELRLSWLARMLDLHEIILEMLPEITSQTTLKLNLSENDRADCEIYRLLNLKTNLERDKDKRTQGGSEPNEAYNAKMLSIIDQILTIANEVNYQRKRTRLLAFLQYKKADILIDQGHYQNAIDILHSASSIMENNEDLADMSREMREYALDLEKIISK